MSGRFPGYDIRRNMIRDYKKKANGNSLNRTRVTGASKFPSRTSDNGNLFEPVWNVLYDLCRQPQTWLKLVFISILKSRYMDDDYVHIPNFTRG